jgi:DNA cross-link repair 1A protein
MMCASWLTPQALLHLLHLLLLVFAGTRLQFVDANHCPGAAMVVAHPPGGLPPVLHTGDARLTREATQQQPALQALVGRAVLVLDTTYADPSYCFPPQQEVLQWVLRAVQVCCC